MNQPIVRSESDLLLSSDKLLRAIWMELQTIVKPELHSPRAQATLDVIEFLLRHLLAGNSAMLQAMQQCAAARKVLLQASRDADAPEHKDDPDAGNIAEILTKTGAALEVQLRQTSLQGHDKSLRLRMLAIERKFVEAAAAADDAAIVSAGEVVMDAALTLAKVQSYFQNRFKDTPGLVVTELTPLLGGFGKETCVVNYSINGVMESVVIRRDLPSGPNDTKAADEFAIVRTLFNNGIEVAEPLWVEDDGSLLGTAFQVSRKVAGATLPALTGIKASPEGRHAAQLLAKFLGKLHALEISRLQLPDIYSASSVQDSIARNLNRWEEWWQKTRREPAPILTAALVWLRQNIPAGSDQPVMLHGDAGLHNMMMDNGRLTAMLDWELAHLGDPMEDLVYCRLWIDQIMPFEEFINIYERAGGPSYRPERERYCSILNNFRLAICCMASLSGFVRLDTVPLAAAYAGIKHYRMFLISISEQLSLALSE